MDLFLRFYPIFFSAVRARQSTSWPPVPGRRIEDNLVIYVAYNLISSNCATVNKISKKVEERRRARDRDGKRHLLLFLDINNLTT